MTPVTATTLTAEIAAVMADVVAFDGTTITGITYAIGRRAQALHASPPRVVWLLAGGPGGTGLEKRFPGGRRSLLTRLPVLRAVCWGADYDATLDLSGAVLAAMARRYGGRVVYQGEEWETDPASTDYGEAVVLSWQWPLAVLDRAPSRVTVTSTSLDTTAAVAGDGTIHLGEP